MSIKYSSKNTLLLFFSALWAILLTHYTYTMHSWADAGLSGDPRYFAIEIFGLACLGALTWTATKIEE